jgi:hypothetical protein
MCVDDDKRDVFAKRSAENLGKVRLRRLLEIYVAVFCFDADSTSVNKSRKRLASFNCGVAFAVFDRLGKAFGY